MRIEGKERVSSFLSWERFSLLWNKLFQVAFPELCLSMVVIESLIVTESLNKAIELFLNAVQTRAPN
jgi:hypothetical protein